MAAAAVGNNAVLDSAYQKLECIGRGSYGDVFRG